MAPRPNAGIGTLLRYTYQVNVVFFAGYTAWYLLREPEMDVADTTHDQNRMGQSGTKH